MRKLMLIITVHDKVAGTWAPPSVAHNSDAAVRDFRTAISRKDTIIGSHPEDFELFAIGEWIVPFEPNNFPSLSVFDNFVFLENGQSHEKV